MMTHEKPARDASLSSVTIRALSSITPEQAVIIAKAVATVEPGWEVQATDDYNGYLSILIAPSISDDKQKLFFVGGTAQNLELFESYDDNMTSLETFNDATTLSERLLDIIGRR